MASHSSRTRVCDTHEREYVTWGHAALHIWSREAGSTKRKSFNMTSSLGCVEKGWWDRFQMEHGGHATKFLRRCGTRFLSCLEFLGNKVSGPRGRIPPLLGIRVWGILIFSAHWISFVCILNCIRLYTYERIIMRNLF